MSMLITMGAVILAERTKEASISVKNVYSLDFGKCKALYQRISKEEEGFALPFKEAQEDRYLQDIYKAAVSMKELAGRLVDHSEGNVFNKMYKIYQTIVFRIEGQFDCFKDMDSQADPFRLKEVVDQTLGIVSSTTSLEDRVRYFAIMKEVGFLKTHHKTLTSLAYDPGLAAKKMLKDPKIQTLILGCGRNLNYIPSCGAEQHENALFVDRNSHIHPDVITDMHSDGFWQEIPDARLEKVLDHTNGFYIFEDVHANNTIKNIYRALKPGGSFTLAHPLNNFAEESIVLFRRQILEEAGFTVESNDRITFHKSKPGSLP